MERRHPPLSRWATMAVRTCARRIQPLDQELMDTVARLDRLTMQHCPDLGNTKGVGVDISATELGQGAITRSL